MSERWIGIDLDGTLAVYDGWKGPAHIGTPIPSMVKRVKEMLLAGKKVRIFTARVFPLGFIPATELTGHMTTIFRYESAVAWEAAQAIQFWCEKHIGCKLPITCIKDYNMDQLWDDRAVQVECNTGIVYVHPQEKETTP